MINQYLQTILKVMMLSAIFAASISNAQPDHEKTRSETTIPPLDDPVNIDVKTNSLNALFIRLEVSENDATAHDMRLTRIPISRADFSDDSSRIVFKAYNQHDEVVGRTSVADRRMNARDGETVILDVRTVYIVVPLIGKPDEIVITIAKSDMQKRLSVSAIVQGYCEEHDAEPFCSDDSPKSSPHYQLLNPPVLRSVPVSLQYEWRPVIRVLPLVDVPNGELRGA